MDDKLNDNSPMPWGKHKGTKMANVPAHYLIWAYEQNKCCQKVRQYVRENWDELKSELKALGNDSRTN